jgi:hypothetical protein
MGVPTLEVGYTSATTGRGDHEVHKGHVVALEEKKKEKNFTLQVAFEQRVPSHFLLWKAPLFQVPQVRLRP